MQYAALGLHRELVAAGLTVDGCRSDPRPDQVAAGLPPEQWAIDWPAAPTPAQLAAARAVLAAHDPTRREREEAAERARLRDYRDRWAALTAAEREDAVRLLFLRSTRDL